MADECANLGYSSLSSLMQKPPIREDRVSRPQRRANSYLIARRAEIICAINRRADIMVERAVERQDLDEENDRHVVTRINPEQRAFCAVPEKFTDGASVFGRAARLRGAHRKIEAEPDGTLIRQENRRVICGSS